MWPRLLMPALRPCGPVKVCCRTAGPCTSERARTGRPLFRGGRVLCRGFKISKCPGTFRLFPPPIPTGKPFALERHSRFHQTVKRFYSALKCFKSDDHIEAWDGSASSWGFWVCCWPIVKTDGAIKGRQQTPRAHKNCLSYRSKICTRSTGPRPATGVLSPARCICSGLSHHPRTTC